MCEGGVGRDVEDREGVFAGLCAAFGEDDADEVDARRAEEWEGC